MNNIIVTTPEELEHLIQSSIRKVLSEKTSPPPIPPPEKPFSIKEAAQYLGLAEQTLYGYTSNGTIPFIKKSRRVMFIKSDLDSWMQEGRKLTVNEKKLKLKEEGKYE